MVDYICLFGFAALMVVFILTQEILWLALSPILVVACLLYNYYEDGEHHPHGRSNKTH